MTVGQFLDVASRSRTRVLFLYGLTGHLSGDDPGVPLTEAFEFGRFGAHLEAASRLLPRIRLDAAVEADALGGAFPANDTAGGAAGTATPRSAGFTRVRLLLVGTPRGDAALVLDGELDGDSSAESVSGLLATSCFDRTGLTVQGQPILDWVAGRLDPTDGTRLKFGRDVHQVVFPGGTLLERTLSGTRSRQVPPAVTDLVYRGTIPAEDGQRLGVRVPPALNHVRTTMVAHGRGVSVVSGWGEPVQNALAVGALTLVCALGVLQRARHAAFDALFLNDRTKLASTADAGTLVSRLSAQLNELQLDLSFGVEAYVDSVLIPDLVVETYQLSLREGMGITESLANTSRMLDRLQSVIQARLSALSSAAHEQGERRHQVFSLIIAIGSLISLPPALLLAFFGVNALEVSPEASIFDIGRYWPAYLVAWMPFLILVVAGFLPLRRIRNRSRQLRIHSRHRRSNLQSEAPGTEPDPSSADPVPRQRAAPTTVDADMGRPDR